MTMKQKRRAAGVALGVALMALGPVATSAWAQKPGEDVMSAMDGRDQERAQARRHQDAPG